MENTIEGMRLYFKLENTGTEAIKYLEDKLDNMRCKLDNERIQRWRSWVENSWSHKKKDIYKWIR
eukprot:11087195-Heterocapsa_arctica.AAC.1